MNQDDPLDLTPEQQANLTPAQNEDLLLERDRARAKRILEGLETTRAATAAQLAELDKQIQHYKRELARNQQVAAADHVTLDGKVD